MGMNTPPRVPYTAKDEARPGDAKWSYIVPVIIIVGFIALVAWAWLTR
jgi:hypothetical protein